MTKNKIGGRRNHGLIPLTSALRYDNAFLAILALQLQMSKTWQCNYIIKTNFDGKIIIYIKFCILKKHLKFLGVSYFGGKAPQNSNFSGSGSEA